MLTVPTLLVILDVETIDNDGLTFSYSYPPFPDHLSWLFVMTFQCEDIVCYILEFAFCWTQHQPDKFLDYLYRHVSIVAVLALHCMDQHCLFLALTSSFDCSGRKIHDVQGVLFPLGLP